MEQHVLTLLLENLSVYVYQNGQAHCVMRVMLLLIILSSYLNFMYMISGLKWELTLHFWFVKWLLLGFQNLRELHDPVYAIVMISVFKLKKNVKMCIVSLCKNLVKHIKGDYVYF